VQIRVRILSEGASNVDQLELKIERRRRYLIEVRDAAGVKTMAALAEKLGVAASHLANIQNAHRSPSKDLVDKFEKLAPSVNHHGIFSEEPGSEAALLWRLEQDYSERLEALQKAVENENSNIDNICRNFGALNKGDVFIYVSTLTPAIEMDKPKETALHEAIANAIQREAFFLYLMPTTEYLRSVDNWNFLDIPALFTAFKSLVVSNISEEKQDQCGSRLLLVQTDANPYFFALPDFKWELFCSENLPGNAAADVLVYSGGIGELVGPKIRIPLSDRSTQGILFEIAKTICSPPVSNQVPDAVIKRLVKFATGKKIQHPQR
jgi:hypothetical protein